MALHPTIGRGRPLAGERQGVDGPILLLRLRRIKDSDIQTMAQSKRELAAEMLGGIPSRAYRH
jgi:hypothetical protein